MFYPGLNVPLIVPVLAACGVGALVGLVNEGAVDQTHQCTYVPLIVPVLAACGVGALVGLVNGTLVAKTRIPPFIATLGTFTAIRGLALLYTGGRPISDLTDSYNFIGQGDVFGLPVPIIILVVMAVVRSSLDIPI